MPRHRFHTLDVFTETAFGGNPLAVVLDADDLGGEAMQRIAAEFNLSETVFVLQPARAGANRKKLRIFTPQAELPFAGHPTIGAGYLLARLQLVQCSASAPLMVLEEGVGDVPVTVRFAANGVQFTQLSVPRMPERGPAPPSRAEVADMLSVEEAGLLPGHDAWSCGVPFLFVPLRDRTVSARLRLRTERWESVLSKWWAKSVFAFTTDTLAPQAHIHARMFAPALGVAEDPATGSAAAALAGFLHHQEPRSGTRRWLIEQGFEMGRPSHIELEADIAAGGINAVRVGGSSVMMSEGSLSFT